MRESRQIAFDLATESALHYLAQMVAHSEWCPHVDCVPMHDMFTRLTNATRHMQITSREFLDPMLHGNYCENFDRDGYCHHF